MPLTVPPSLSSMLPPGVQPADLLRQVVRKIEVKTALGPPIMIDDPLGPGEPSRIMDTLQPAVIVHFARGAPPMVVSPWGAPPPTKWPYIRSGLAVAGIGAATWLTWLAVRRLL